MIFRALKWLITPQPRRLSDISLGARDTGASDTPELGMEATDMDLIGQVTRRNQSLEQSSRYGGRGHWASASILPKRFKDDDIGYARKFHKTFQKGKSTNDR